MSPGVKVHGKGNSCKLREERGSRTGVYYCADRVKPEVEPGIFYLFTLKEKPCPKVWVLSASAGYL